MRATDSYARLIVVAAQRRVRAVVDDLRARVGRRRASGRCRSRRARRSSRARPRRAGTTSGRGRRSAAPCAGTARRRCARRRSGRAPRITCAPPTRRTPHQDGPTGPVKLPAARRSPSPSTIERQLRQRPPGRPEEHLAAVRRVERRVVARADERRLRLRVGEGRLAVERDRAARVRADLRVGDDAPGAQPCGRRAGRARRQADDDERRAELLAVARPRGTRCRTTPARCRAPRAAARPRRRAAGRAATGVRASWSSCRAPGRASARASAARARVSPSAPRAGERDQPPAREAAAALLDDLLDLVLLGGMLRLGVRLVELLGDDEALRDHDAARRRAARTRAPSARPSHCVRWPTRSSA